MGEKTSYSGHNVICNSDSNLIVFELVYYKIYRTCIYVSDILYTFIMHICFFI